jgi:ribosomal protein S18 acetylase RimI-like enzyme
VTTDTSNPGDAAVIDLIDAFCDAIPRRLARAEAHGPLVLFVTVPGEEEAGAGWPYYARPRRGATEEITAGHVRAVRARQRELGVPESFEWIAQVVPGLVRTATAAGLEVAAHPLMILEDPAEEPARPAGVTVRAVPEDEPDLASVVAVPDVAFAHPGTSPGSPGPAERDKLAADRDPASIARMRTLLASGHSVLVAAFGDEGPLAAGSCQAVNGVAEITGVGTLPSARRCGLGSAVTARLAALAFERGAHTVFLSASDDAVARVYASIGFRRVGTAMIADPV